MIESTFPRVVFELGGVAVRDTVVVTWVLMILLIAWAWVVRRRLADRPGMLQAVLEATVEGIEGLVAEITDQDPARFLPFIGTLALFLVASDLASIFPMVGSPTRDLSTTAALAAIVFFSVHYYGIRTRGLRPYLKSYLEPSVILLPFNVIGEISRTIALALRLFGNMLSGELVVAIVLLLAGLLVPVPLQLFGLLIGLVQAYVFTLLAMIYIGAAVESGRRRTSSEPPEGPTQGATP